MEIKQYMMPFEVKQTGQDDEFYHIEGIASTPDMDMVEDIVQPDAIMGSVEEYGMPSFRKQHASSEGPIGVFDEITKKNNKILVKARIPKKDEEGNLLARMAEIFALAKMGAYKGLSIGFRTLKSIWDEDIRIIQEMNLIEISLVDKPCNQNALVTGVKSAEAIKEIEKAEKLPDVEKILHEAGFSNKGTEALISKVAELKSQGDLDESEGDLQEDVSKELSEFSVNMGKLKQTMEK